MMKTPDEGYLKAGLIRVHGICFRMSRLSGGGGGVELSSVLTARNLLIPGTATTAKKASLPAPLCVYCTKMLFVLKSNRQVATTDGPYAETKEQLGGIQILEARDLNHAVQLISQLPGFKYGLGPIEIRPVADLNEMMKESEKRRRRKDTSR
jgi:hypothetical protein